MVHLDQRGSPHNQWFGTLWRHWAAPCLTAVGSIAVLPWDVTAPLLISGALVASAASIVATRLSRRDALRLQLSQAELSIIAVLNNVFPTIENFDEDAPAASNLRGCIISFHDEIGRISYSYGGYSRLEQSLVWHGGEGLAGTAFAKKAMIRAPEDVPLPFDLSGDPGTWRLTDDQRRAIAGKVGTATAFPMFDEHNAVRAVLLLEDSRPPALSDLRRKGIQGVLERRVVTPIRDQLLLTKFASSEATRPPGAS